MGGYIHFWGWVCPEKVSLHFDACGVLCNSQERLQAVLTRYLRDERSLVRRAALASLLVLQRRGARLSTQLYPAVVRVSLGSEPSAETRSLAVYMLWYHTRQQPGAGLVWVSFHGMGRLFVPRAHMMR